MQTLLRPDPQHRSENLRVYSISMNKRDSLCSESGFFSFHNDTLLFEQNSESCFNRNPIEYLVLDRDKSAFLFPRPKNKVERTIEYYSYFQIESEIPVTFQK